MADMKKDLAEFLAMRGPALFGYACALCRNRSEAQDLVQDALVAYLSRPPRTVGNPEAYIKTAIFHSYVDNQRRAANLQRKRHLIAAIRPDISPPAHEVSDTRADIHGAMADLTPMQRAVVIRFYSDDQSLRTIAKELHCSEGNIKRHLSDAREKLAKSLAEYSQKEIDNATK